MYSNETAAREEAPRTLKQTAGEVAALSVMAIIAGVGFPVMNAVSLGYDGVKFVEDAGKSVVAALGGVVPIHAAVLIAFYVVVIGGQVLGKAGEAQQLRRRLGIIAELLAAAMAPVIVYALFYCLTSRAEWVPVLVMWMPVIAVEFFFSIQLGVFNFFPLAERIRGLDRRIERYDERLEGLMLAPALPNLWCALLPLPIPALVMTFVLGPSDPGGALLGFILALVFSSIVSATLFVPLYIFRTSFDRLARFACWIIPGFVFLAFLFAAVGFVASGEGTAATGRSWLVSMGFCLISLLFPLRFLPGFLRFLSIRHVANQAAYRRVEGWRKRAAAERDELRKKQAPEAQDDPNPSRLNLILAALRAR